MRSLVLVMCAFCLVSFCGADVLGLELEIRVAPQTLVLSSSGGKLTIHTNVPYDQAAEVSLQVSDKDVPVRTYEDDRGFLYAQCTKEAIAKLLEGGPKKFESLTVTLTVTLIDGSSELASESIRVKK
ncbi:MAG TPA: hypothetical protein VMY42_10490 [Thermoguttaceae bacterium]|nr:hypothetical protein [Thermoguttaceae bacterium]